MLLALKFHWSRESIMNLSVAEFSFYTDELTKISQP